MSKNPDSLQNSAQVLEFEVGQEGMVVACVGSKKMIFSKSSYEGAFFHLCKYCGTLSCMWVVSPNAKPQLSNRTGIIKQMILP